MKWILISFLIFALWAFTVQAATIEGVVYDFALIRVDQAIVEISSNPLQRMVAVDGRYSFEVAPGNFTLKAEEVRNQMVSANASQVLFIPSEGHFNLDLILSPIIEMSDDPIEEVDLEGLFPKDQSFNQSKADFPWSDKGLLSLALILAIAAGFWEWRRRQRKGMANKPPSQESAPSISDQHFTSDQPLSSSINNNGSVKRPDLQELIQVLTKEDGRATQRDLRRQLPFSEAKVSLMLTELEHDGVVKKIRKGRGNIIILQKKME